MNMNNESVENIPTKYALSNKKNREYRLTRDLLYESPQCYGHLDLSVRQGHYIMATSVVDAIRQMNVMYPFDNGNFTCQLWKEW